MRRRYDSIRTLHDKAFQSACYAPFVSLFFTTQGRVLACCKNGSFALGDVGAERLRDIWNGPRARQLRDALKGYRFNLDCAYCEWEITSGNYETATPRLFDELPVASESPEWPLQLEFEGSNTCNFECIMCNGYASSSIRANRDGLPALARPYGDRFFEDLRPFLPHLRRGRFFGGEPFLTPESQRIWDMMIEANLSIECHVTTNGSQYNRRVVRWLEALPFHLTISIDGATKATLEKIRINARFEEVTANIRRFIDYSRARGTSCRLAFCLMRQNWHEFMDLLLFAEDLDVEVMVNTVIDPSVCSLYTLPRQQLTAITDRLEEQGAASAGRLTRNARAWKEALVKLRSAHTDDQRRALQDVLSRFFVVDSPLQTAWELTLQRKHAEALTVARTVPDRDADYYYALDTRAYNQCLLNDTAGAERDLERALAISTKRPDAYLNMARVRSKQQRLDEAIACATLAYERTRPEEAYRFQATELLAVLEMRRGHPMRAIGRLSALADLQGDDAPIAGLVYPLTGLRGELANEIDANPRRPSTRLSVWLVSRALAARRHWVRRRRRARLDNP